MVAAAAGTAAVRPQERQENRLDRSWLRSAGTSTLARIVALCLAMAASFGEEVRGAVGPRGYSASLPALPIDTSASPDRIMYQ